MLRKLKEFEYFAPKNIPEAISLLDQYQGKAKLFAGGTDVLIQMKQRKLIPEYLIDVKNIDGLNYLKYNTDEGLKIGAYVTHGILANSEIVQEKYTALAEGSLAVGSVQTRNRGTIVGNICTSSPSADTPPSLIAFDANIKLISIEGERVVKITDFFLSPFKNCMKENELITEIQLSDLPPNTGSAYLWLPKITALDETLVGVGLALTLNNIEEKVCTNIRIGLGSVSPMPMRANNAEEFIKGKSIDDDIIEKAAEIASKETSPRSRAEYRKEMVSVYVKRALNKALERIK